MRLTKSLLALVLFSACLDPSRPIQSVRRTIRVALGDDPTMLTGWRPEQRAWLTAHLARMSLAGLGWELATVATASTADVEVRPYDAGAGCALGAGRYQVGQRFVQLDPACLPGEFRLQYGMAHELGHWVTATQTATPWSGHLCRTAGERSDCHPTVFGIGVMAATIPEGNEAIGEDPAPPDPLPTRDDERLLEAVGVR